MIQLYQPLGHAIVEVQAARSILRACCRCRQPGSEFLPRSAAMAPRSSIRATQQADAAVKAVKINELPEAVLAKCLGFLDLKQRCAPGPGRLRRGRANMQYLKSSSRQAAVVAGPFAAATALAARDHLLS